MLIHSVREQATQAAYNNAIWCDVMCQAHGVPGDVLDGIWVNRQVTPPFYPNVVTFSHKEVDRQVEQIRELLSAGIPGEWAVKDSFCTLDLVPLGFHVLFDATWIYRPVIHPPEAKADGIEWRSVGDQVELAAWERAWRGDTDVAADPHVPRIFPPALLDRRDVVVLAAYRHNTIVAGAIANRSRDVVGISNVFTPGQEAVLFWAGAMTAAMAAFPGLPLVGYEAGKELEYAQAVGFGTLETLRVWARQPTSSTEADKTI